MKKNAREAIRAEKDGTNFLTALLKNMLSVRCASNPDFFLTLFGRKETVIMKKNWKQFVWSNGQQDLVWASSKAAEYLVIYAVGVLVLPDVPLATLFSFLFASDIFNNGVYQFACHLESRTQAEACIGSMKPFLETLRWKRALSGQLRRKDRHCVLIMSVSDMATKRFLQM